MKRKERFAADTARMNRTGQPLQKRQEQRQPLLKENRLIEEGVIAPAKPAMREKPSVLAGAQRRVPGMREVDLERRPVLEKFVAIDGEQYRVQGDSVLELKENERLLRMQLEVKRQEDPTLNQYFQEWIERRVKTAAKPATPYRYRQFYHNHMRDGIGLRRIRDLKRRDVLALQAELLEKVSPGTVNYLIQLLRLILNDAVADEIITRNPAANVKRLKEARTARGTAAQTNHRALTEEEQKLFLKAVRDTFYYEYFAFLLLTGLRQGEGSALHWGDVDWEENVIHVRGTLTFDDNGHIIIGPPKSRAGEREVPMNATIRRVLEMERKKLVRLWGQRAAGADAVVFPSSTGGILHNATANKAIVRTLALLESEGTPVEHFSVHALRDTFATRFIEQGGTPQTLKALLGHASIKMTMDLYAHVLPNTKQKEMDMVVIEIE